MSERSPVPPRTCRQNAAPNKSVRLRALAFPCRDCSFYLFLQRDPFVYLRNTSIRWHSLSQFFCGKRLRCLHAALPESRFYSSLYAETSMISRHGSASCIPPSIRLFVCMSIRSRSEAIASANFVPWQGVHASVYADRFCLLSSGSNMSETDKKSRCQFPVLTSSHVGIELSSSVFQQTQTRV